MARGGGAFVRNVFFSAPFWVPFALLPPARSVMPLSAALSELRWAAIHTHWLEERKRFALLFEHETWALPVAVVSAAQLEGCELRVHLYQQRSGAVCHGDAHSRHLFGVAPSFLYVKYTQ